MTNIQPKSTTVGTTVDSWIADFHARIASLEASAKTDESKAVTWIKTNWPHFVTWLAAGVGTLKAFGKI